MSAVYVDDFLLAAVQNKQGTLLTKAMQATLHAIHNIFPPPKASDPERTKDPILEKKLDKGDARWDTIKEILGYELDGRGRTVKLPDPKSEALLKELRKVLRKQRVPLKRFRSLVGPLQHAARILPAAKSFFTPMNKAMQGLLSFIGLGQHSDVRHALLDAGVLIAELARRPTHVSELVAHEFNYVGFCDASAFGAGGVWFSGNKHIPPTVWHVEFPPDITAEVVSDKNPNGKLTNSDLEMAGVLMHYLALEQIVPDLVLMRSQAVIGCDNTPAVAWTRHMATQASSPVSHRLLQGLAMRQRITQAAPPRIFHTAGDGNILADVASHAIALLLESSGPVAFLAYFNARFPLPQSPSWTHVMLDFAQSSNVILTLRGQQLELRRWTTKTARKVGLTGSGTPLGPMPTPICKDWIALSDNICSLPLPLGFELASTEKASKLDTSLWRKPCITWRKPSSWRGMMTHEKPTGPKSLICPSAIC
jgi:hypothetical protein